MSTPARLVASARSQVACWKTRKSWVPATDTTPRTAVTAHAGHDGSRSPATAHTARARARGSSGKR